MSEKPSPNGRYPHVQRLIFETPWAVELPVLSAIREMVALRAAGGHYGDHELQARIGAGPARKNSQRVGNVAVLPLYGVITPRADLMSEMSGGTSIERIRANFLNAVDDKDITAIVLDVSSPGGLTDMVPEFAADIRAARGTKPIVAVANTKAGSAAYWLASQADEIVVTPSGTVGSIGVFAAHDDLSGAMEKAGIKTTLVSAGKDKTLANPYEPLSADARAMIQERVDETYQMFTLDVSKGRRVPVANVRDGFGQGRMLTAKQAVKEGMADSIGTLEQTVQRLAAGRDMPAAMAAMITDAATVTSTTYVDGKKVSDALTEAFASEFVARHSQPHVSFTDQAAALHDDAVALVERVTSLAEVREGRLTKAKRQSLAACSGAIRESADAIDSVLADTDPNKHSALLNALYLSDLERRHLSSEQEHKT